VKIITPTIHMNGSNAESLKNEYLNAYEVAGQLLDALDHIDLNARDYYVQKDPDAFAHARDQASARYMKVRAIRAELETIIQSIQEQQPSPKF
jgi:hypothetical protein